LTHRSPARLHALDLKAGRETELPRPTDASQLLEWEKAKVMERAMAMVMRLELTQEPGKRLLRARIMRKGKWLRKEGTI